MLQLAGRRVPLELKLLHSVQNIEGVIKLLDFYERPDSFIYVMERPATSKVDTSKLSEVHYYSICLNYYKYNTQRRLLLQPTL